MRFLFIAFCLLFGSMNVSAETLSSQPINLNQATVPQLMTLKGVGKKRAQAIFDYRQAHGNFHEVKDLLSVQGMNQKLLDKIEKNNEGRLIVKN
jgi:competence protein ComEA